MYAKKLFFVFIFSPYNLPAGTLPSVLKVEVFAKFCAKILFCKHYFSPLNTFMRKGKDPDPYLWLMDPDPDPYGQKHADPAPDPDPYHFCKHPEASGELWEVSL